jgi:single-strand DNA-binding protein
MNNLNSIILEGNLVRDPDLRLMPNGKQVCNFKLASNRFHKNEEGFVKEVGFFDVETWGKAAEICKGQGRKGMALRVVGRLKQEQWKDGEGQPHSKIIIVADNVEFKQEQKRENAASHEADAGEGFGR